MSVEKTLDERGSRYGDFSEHARIAQELQNVMRSCANPFDTTQNDPNWNRLSPTQKQALTVIADKIARILSGDPNYVDNWHDIQGYAKLVEDRLSSKPDIDGWIPWDATALQAPLGPAEPHNVYQARLKNGSVIPANLITNWDNVGSSSIVAFRYKA